MNYDVNHVRSLVALCAETFAYIGAAPPKPTRVVTLGAAGNLYPPEYLLRLLHDAAPDTLADDVPYFYGDWVHLVTSPVWARFEGDVEVLGWLDSETEGGDEFIDHLSENYTSASCGWWLALNTHDGIGMAGCDDEGIRFGVVFAITRK